MTKDKSYNIGVSLAKLVNAFPSPTSYSQKRSLNSEVSEYLIFLFVALREIHQEYDSTSAVEGFLSTIRCPF